MPPIHLPPSPKGFFRPPFIPPFLREEDSPPGKKEIPHKHTSGVEEGFLRLVCGKWSVLCSNFLAKLKEMLSIK